MKRRTHLKPKKKGFLLDLILVFITGGLWLIFMLVRFLKRNS